MTRCGRAGGGRHGCEGHPVPGEPQRHPEPQDAAQHQGLQPNRPGTAGAEGGWSSTARSARSGSVAQRLWYTALRSTHRFGDRAHWRVAVTASLLTNYRHDWKVRVGHFHPMFSAL
jgi:hypothetical protein